MGEKWITISETGMAQVQGELGRLRKSLQGVRRNLCQRVLTPLQRRVLKSMGETSWSPGAPSREPLYKRSGDTMRYLSAQPFNWGSDSVSWGARADAPEGRRIGFLETGGTITPKGGRALAIPLPAALTARGVLKSEFANGIRNSGRLIFMLSRQGKPPLLCEYVRGAKAILPLFILKTSATLRAHPTFRNAVEGGAPDINEALSAANVAVAIEQEKK